MIPLRLDKLREKLKEHNFAGYIVPSGDEFLSEYTPSYAKRLEYITGFTGSNGIVVILMHKALFFTDGRYITQSFSELDSNLFEIYDINLIRNFNWLEVVNSGEYIAYDPKLVTRNFLSQFSRLNLIVHNNNLIDRIWVSKPLKPSSDIYEYKPEFAGADTKSKIYKCRNFIKQHGAEALIITDPASVCWVLNIRASDVEFSPLLLSYLIITGNDIILLVDPLRNITGRPPGYIRQESLENLAGVIESIPGKILYDPSQATDYVVSILSEHEATRVDNPCMILKACKNEREIYHAKQGHIQDALAVCELLALIDAGYFYNKSEYDIGQKLTELRAEGRNYIYDSFPTICGFQENGAVIHYKARKESSKIITNDGMLLIDSGGQYLGATTDVTRTVYIGAPSKEHKTAYTLVLKGHIALAVAKFPNGKITGAHLDILARQYLWQYGLDYAHGTGHGVGNFLSVHEGPQSISLASISHPLRPGMILSNEPGYYQPGHFGIRIENLIYVKEAQEQNFLEFKNLTLVPYDYNLIDFAILTENEINYLKSYYTEIKQLIYPELSRNAKAWLIKQVELSSL